MPVLLGLAAACGPGPDGAPGPPPPRLAILHADLGAVVVELGLGGAVVGADALARLRPELAGAADLGDPCSVAVEQIAAVEPDRVLLLGDACGLALEPRLRDAGLSTLVVAPRSLNEVVESYHRLGAVLGRERAAQRAVAVVIEGVSRIAVRRDGRERHRVVWLVARDPLTAVGAQGMLHELLELAGGENAFHETGADHIAVTRDEIAARQPDRVLDSSPDPPTERSGIPAERIAPELARLPALDVLERVRRLHALLYPNG